jgi:hypothetical protein
MNFRHAAALALVGWYLIGPPRYLLTGRPAPEAPLTEWTAYDTYATQAECLNERDKRIKFTAGNHPMNPKLATILEQQRKFPPGTIQKMNDHNFEWSLLNQCVKADDPRLKAK